MSERFARNSLFSTLAGLGTALGSLLSMVLVARLLGPAGTGQIAYGLWIAVLAVTFADFGIYQSLTRYLPALTAEQGEEAARALGAYLLRPALAFAVLGALGFAYWALTAPAGGAVPPTTWGLIGLLFLLQLVASFGLGALRGMQRFDLAAKLTLASLALQLLAVAAGALLAGVNGALLGYCAGQILPIAALGRVLRHPAVADKALRRRVMRFALFAWAGALTNILIWSRLEIPFLQHYHDVETVALFTASLTFANLASQGPLLLTGALLPHFAESHARQSLDQLRSTYATATRVMALLLFPTCFGLAAILPALLPLVYGPAFVGALPAGEILVAGAAVGASGAVGSQMIYARERSDFIFLSGLAGAALSVAACFAVIPQFGLVGAAWARLAVHSFMVAFGSWFVWRRLDCPIPLVALAKMSGAALLCAAAARLCIVVIANPVLAIAVAIPSSAVVYAFAIRLFAALPPQDIARLTAFAARLPTGMRPPVTGVLTLLAPSRA